MPLQIIRNDITKIKCDAIVNAANNTLLGGGGVDGAIHRAAGKKLLEECRTLGGCLTGEAKITGGYNLPCRYVIHTVGPIWNGGSYDEENKLISCYRNSLLLAKQNGCESVAFPLISAGAYKYPKEDALRIATETISDFLNENDMLVYLVVFDKKSFSISQKLKKDVQSYIDDNYIDSNLINRRFGFGKSKEAVTFDGYAESMPMADISETVFMSPMPSYSSAKLSLDDELESLDESFSEMLIRKIDEKGMKDSECYKKANIDRKLFSKIRNDKFYKPSKSTVIAFIIALELPLNEANDMLLKAGFALSHSNKFDIIVEYFIKNRNYNIFEINEVLFEFDQNLIGSIA